MVAATCTAVATIQHEFFGAQSGQACLFVQSGRVVHQLLPAAGRVDIHLDNAGVRCDQQFLQAGITRRLIALDAHRQLEFGRSVFDMVDQVYVMFQMTDRWQEQVQTSLTGFNAQCRA